MVEAVAPVMVPIGSGWLVVTPVVVRLITAVPVACPESRKAGWPMKVSRAPVPSGTDASKAASSEVSEL